MRQGIVVLMAALGPGGDGPVFGLASLPTIRLYGWSGIDNGQVSLDTQTFLDDLSSACSKTQTNHPKAERLGMLVRISSFSSISHTYP